MQSRRRMCPINHCGRKIGIATYLTLSGYGRANDRVVAICEYHWKALASILPVESGSTLPRGNKS